MKATVYAQLVSKFKYFSGHRLATALSIVVPSYSECGVWLYGAKAYIYKVPSIVRCSDALYIQLNSVLSHYDYIMSSQFVGEILTLAA
jgi:hypothetical protein